jgi:hypothetical protein
MEIRYKLSENAACWPSTYCCWTYLQQFVKSPSFPRSRSSEELKYVCNLAITDGGKVTGSFISLLPN